MDISVTDAFKRLNAKRPGDERRDDPVGPDERGACGVAVGPRAEMINVICVNNDLNVGPGGAGARGINAVPSTRRVSNALHDSAGCAQEKVVKASNRASPPARRAPMELSSILKIILDVGV